MLKSTATRSLRSRIAVLAVAGLAALSISTGVAQAEYSDSNYSYFTLPSVASASMTCPGAPCDRGDVVLHVVCDHWSHHASVAVGFETPMAERNGLWVETRLYYRDHNQSSWSVLDPSRQQFAQTVVQVGSDMWKSVGAHLVTKSFYGTPLHTYDVGVLYRLARPGAYWSDSIVLAATSVLINTGYNKSWWAAGQCQL